MYGIYPAKLFNRIAAFVLDAIIVFLVFVAFDSAAMKPLANKIWNYDTLVSRYQDYQIEYGIAYYDEDGNYVSVENVDEKAWDAFQSDEEVRKVAASVSYIALIVTSINLFVGEAVAFLLFPLIFKNGRSVGLKMMRMALVSTNGLRVKFWQLLARFLIGFFAVESVLTLELIYLIGPFGIAPLIFSAILMFATKKRMALHDFIAGTQVIDFDKTLIFDYPGEREAHEKEYLKAKETEDEERKKRAMKESQNVERSGLLLPPEEEGEKGNKEGS